MPSKNSINKPKDHIHRAAKGRHLRNKRQTRQGKSTTTIRSSRGSTELVTLERGSSIVANTVLSNKKAKKLLRNKKYALQRAGGKQVSSMEQSDEMVDIDQDLKAQEKVRNALWAIVESANVNKVLPTGQGTTLGDGAF
ncbi:Alb1 protein [Martiniozyma asiatica (nom. inval.)]|nr:Alb1 protein [Martiniozyma asiatica]